MVAFFCLNLMKYIYLICIAIVSFSCGNIKAKNQHAVVYEFVNPDKVSLNDKQGTIVTLKNRLESIASNYEVTLNNKQQIEVIVNTDVKLERLHAILTNRGKLGFWECLKHEQLYEFLYDALNNFKLDDSLKTIDEIIKMPANDFGALFSVSVKDTAQITAYFNRKEIRGLLPVNMRNTKFLFGLPDDSQELGVYAVKPTSSGSALVNETHITEARPNYDFLGNPCVSMQMNQKGAQRWERMTAKAHREQSRIAIALNDIVYSAPGVSNGAILGGNTEISGGFTLEETQDLAFVLSSNKRIPKIKFVEALAIND